MAELSRRTFLGSSATLGLGLGFGSGVSASAQDALPTGDVDTIVTGGNVLTMDLDQPTAEAIAVCGDRILAPFTLTAVCSECQRYTLLDHDALANRFGWQVLIPDIKQRGRCAQCGNR
jgi:hypothetical protein